MRNLILIVAAMVAAAPASAQSVKAGIEAWQQADYAKAVAIWRPLAEQGDADAAFNLGQAYRLGRGVPINLGAAQAWLERAARKGHVDAQATLGLLLFDTGNRSAGMRWLKGAAEKGDPRALLIYGTALFNGDGVESDPVLAYAYVSRAAAQGLPPAKETLAEMDRILPLEQRKRGVAVALQKATSKPPAKAAPAAKAAAVKAAPAKAAATSAPRPVASASAASGRWRIQLGAFAQRSSAQALFERVSAIAAISGKRAFLEPAGKVFRLQVGPYASRSEAAAACASLKGQPCFPVAAK